MEKKGRMNSKGNSYITYACKTGFSENNPNVSTESIAERCKCMCLSEYGC